MANFQRIKDELEKSGELMLKLGSGEKLELHKHNVSFDDSTHEIKVGSLQLLRHTGFQQTL